MGRFEDWESPTVERFTYGNEVWIRGFESFPRSGFPVNFPISRLGDRRRSIILFCSVFSLLFFIYKQRCCNNWDNWDECREIFPWVNMADLKFKFQRLIKDDFFSSRILTFGSLFVFHFYFMQSIWYICV